MTNIRILVNKTSKLTFLLLALSFICISTGCKTEPEDPTIEELKTCRESGIEDAVCSSNVNTFDEDTPRIYVSGIFDHIDRNTNITFTLFAKDGSGNWINLASTTSKPSDFGDFDEDASRFKLNVYFVKSETVQWIKTDYRIDAEISGALATGDIEFMVE